MSTCALDLRLEVNNIDQENLERAAHMLFEKSFTRTATAKDTLMARRKAEQNLGWCFIAKSKVPGSKELDLSKTTKCRTFSTLMKIVSDEHAIFWTPNTYDVPTAKTCNTLQHINAVIIDIDDESLDLVSVFERIQVAGLPVPSIINKTPRGYHVYWVLKERVKATQGAQNAYKKITAAMCTLLAGDTFAKDATHYFRIPRAIEYIEEKNLSNWTNLREWANTAQPEVKKATRCIQRISGKKSGIMQDAAVVALMQGVGNGNRNYAAFALGTALKFAGHSEDAAMAIMTEWNTRNTPPLSKSELKSRVKSAYRKADGRVAAKTIAEITGITMVRKGWVNHKLARKDRDKSSKKEWIRDLYGALLKHGGSVIGAQASIAASLKMPERTFKQLIADIKEGAVPGMEVSVEGKGRGARTTIKLVQKENNVQDAVESNYKNTPAETLEDPLGKVSSSTFNADENKPNEHFSIRLKTQEGCKILPFRSPAGRGKPPDNPRRT